MVWEKVSGRNWRRRCCDQLIILRLVGRHERVKSGVDEKACVKVAAHVKKYIGMKNMLQCSEMYSKLCL